MFKSSHSSSKVSKDGSLSTPYASRPFKARPAVSTDYPEALHRSMAWRQDYFSLSDPHLAHYFKAKLLMGVDRPISRAFSSLSFRTQSESVHTVISAHESYDYVIIKKTNHALGRGISIL